MSESEISEAVSGAVDAALSKKKPCAGSSGNASAEKLKSNSDRMVITNRMGFVRSDGNSDVEDVENTYFFMAEPLKEVLAGLDLRAVVADLMRAGVVVNQGGKPNKVFHVPGGGGKLRLYQIDRDKLDGGNDSPET